MSGKFELPSGRRGLDRYVPPPREHDWRGGFAPEPQRGTKRPQTPLEDWEALHPQIQAALNPSDVDLGQFRDYYANDHQAGALFDRQLGFATFNRGAAATWRLYLLRGLRCEMETQLPSPPPLMTAHPTQSAPAVEQRPPVGTDWDGTFTDSLPGFLGHLPHDAVTVLLNPFRIARRRPTAHYTWRGIEDHDRLLLARVHVTNGSRAAWLWGSRRYDGPDEEFISRSPWSVRVWTADVDKTASEARMAVLRARFEQQVRGRRAQPAPPGSDHLHRVVLPGGHGGRLRRFLRGEGSS